MTQRSCDLDALRPRRTRENNVQCRERGILAQRQIQGRAHHTQSVRDDGKGQGRLRWGGSIKHDSQFIYCHDCHIDSFTIDPATTFGYDYDIVDLFPKQGRGSKDIIAGLHRSRRASASLSKPRHQEPASATAFVPHGKDVSGVQPRPCAKGAQPRDRSEAA